ncbi:hypothetical protein OPKNFCMD_3408 [Methylobacterium crusticola]|uniref:EamA domain-containing protein n=1 Tax=Methylobacterium crusticola TaxID=1697972 RepID=A0ABQ4R127_9HYPH|nr:DMT family transporter [Methylobacterium crusticola]GJD50665.1 hypothetical protein OPKNFCMD_3408 [Methylobacterium crusticola]
MTRPAPAGTPPDAGSPRAAYALLTLTALLWAGNAVASKWAVGAVSPQALTGLRWAIACTLLAGLAGRQIVREWSALAPHWRRILLMGGFGYTLFNGLYYAAGAYTSTVNLVLFQGSIPVLVILLNFAVYRHAVSLGQAAGVTLTLAGVVLAASHGDGAVLRELAFNRGDLLLVVACLLYAGYTVALPSRPRVSGLVFFSAMAVAAWLTSLPLMAAEWASGRLVWPGATGWALIAFTALGPSLAAQLAFMRGVEMIGPNRAGLFVNLVPVFGALLAVLLVGEPFGATEGLALALVVGGIAVAEAFGRRRAG